MVASRWSSCILSQKKSQKSANDFVVSQEHIFVVGTTPISLLLTGNDMVTIVDSGAVVKLIRVQVKWPDMNYLAEPGSSHLEELGGGSLPEAVVVGTMLQVGQFAESGWQVDRMQDEVGSMRALDGVEACPPP